MNYLVRQRQGARRRLMAEWANRARRLPASEPGEAAPQQLDPAPGAPDDRRHLPFELLDPVSAVAALTAPRGPHDNGAAVVEPTTPAVAGMPAEPAPIEVAATIVPPSEEEQLCQRARQAWERRDLARAARLYRELLARDARHVEGRYNLALVLDELGEHEQALEELDRCRAIDAASFEVRVNRGAVLASLGRYLEAERELLDVLDQDPPSGAA